MVGNSLQEYCVSGFGCLELATGFKWPYLKAVDPAKGLGSTAWACSHVPEDKDASKELFALFCPRKTTPIPTMIIA